MGCVCSSEHEQPAATGWTAESHAYPTAELWLAARYKLLAAHCTTLPPTPNTDANDAVAPPPPAPVIDFGRPAFADDLPPDEAVGLPLPRSVLVRISELAGGAPFELHVQWFIPRLQQLPSSFDWERPPAPNHKHSTERTAFRFQWNTERYPFAITARTASAAVKYRSNERIHPLEDGVSPSGKSRHNESATDLRPCLKSNTSPQSVPPAVWFERWCLVSHERDCGWNRTADSLQSKSPPSAKELKAIESAAHALSDLTGAFKVLCNENSHANGGGSGSAGSGGTECLAPKMWFGVATRSDRDSVYDRIADYQLVLFCQTVTETETAHPLQPLLQPVVVSSVAPPPPAFPTALQLVFTVRSTGRDRATAHFGIADSEEDFNPSPLIAHGTINSAGHKTTRSTDSGDEKQPPIDLSQFPPMIEVPQSTAPRGGGGRGGAGVIKSDAEIAALRKRAAAAATHQRPVGVPQPDDPDEYPHSNDLAVHGGGN